MTHWSDGDILQHLYGIGPDEAHLSECAACRDRVASARAHRQDIEPRWIPPAALARPPRRAPYFWALAAACAVLAVVPFRPAPPPEPLVTAADQHLYLDIYASMDAGAPRAAEPLQALFEGESR